MEPDSNYRILITGLSGFTGRYLARKLAREGWEICGLGAPALPDSSDAIYPNLDADLSETGRIADWIAANQTTHIAHLAAQSHVIGDPLRFYRDNLLGTESLLEAVSMSGVTPEKILIASSANIYGNCETSPISEDEPYRPVNHYASSKVAMELLVQKWFDRYPIIITRPFNYTGPGQSEAFLFPKLVGAFHRKDPVITLGNIDVARDLSDVNFVIDAYVRLLQSPVRSDRFNICSGKSVSIREAIAILSKLTGHVPKIVSDPALTRRNEITELRGDPSKLQHAIGSTPNYDPVEIFRNMLDAYGNSEFRKIV
jgi:GDP-6-deoxy-D-talose 4-dehydrogenase